MIIRITEIMRTMARLSGVNVEKLKGRECVQLGINFFF